jgi:hypothetical protein
MIEQILQRFNAHFPEKPALDPPDSRKAGDGGVHIAVKAHFS